MVLRGGSNHSARIRARWEVGAIFYSTRLRAVWDVGNVPDLLPERKLVVEEKVALTSQSEFRI